MRDFSSAVAQSEMKNFPFRGPRAAKEYMTSLLELDLNFLQHHMNWRVKSGVMEKSSICRVHKTTCDALHMMQSYDQMNLWNLAAGEHLIRQLILWETAVRRNPKNPDFEGLDVVLSPMIDEGGAVNTKSFQGWVATQQKEDAVVMKGARMLREERDAEDKRSKAAPAGGARGK